MVAATEKTAGNDGLSDQEGCDAFEAALLHPYSRLLISKQPLEKIFNDFHNTPKTENIKHVDTLEHKVKAVWMEVLGVKKINNDSDFFALGGDSLSAIQLSYRLKTVCNIYISPDGLLEHSNFKNFLKYINEAHDL